MIQNITNGIEIKNFNCPKPILKEYEKLDITDQEHKNINAKKNYLNDYY